MCPVCTPRLANNRLQRLVAAKTRTSLLVYPIGGTLT